MSTPDSIDGFVTTTAAARILEGKPGIRRTVRLITLYNPNNSASTFVLRRIFTDAIGEELIAPRFDDSIPATDSWIFGSLGGRMVIKSCCRLELILDASPTKPIIYSIDYGDEPDA